MKKLLLFIVFILAGNCIAQVTENYGPTDNKYPNNYIEYNSKMYYFVRNFGGFGFTLLYATDGTAANNQLIATLGFSSTGDLNDENEFNTHKIIFNNKLFFVYDKRLWSTDGTTAGTTQFSSTLNAVKYFKIFNNKLYFTALTAANGAELWSTDGTLAGTQMVKDINPGANGAFYNLFNNPHFTLFNNKLFFVATDGIRGYELWSTDGTDAGTSLLKDIRTVEATGNGSGAFWGSFYNPYPFKVVGNKMYFGANPNNRPGGSAPDVIDTGSFILYQTDGTAAGTFYVQPPLASSNNYNYISMYGLTDNGNKLFIHGKMAYDNTGFIPKSGILLLDGTNPITLLKEMYGDVGDVGTSDETERYSMRLFNNDFYFIGYTDSRDRLNLWKMNPNDYTFTQMTQTPSNNLSEFSDDIGDLRLLVSTTLNGRLHYVKTRYGNGSVFSTDGTVSGSRQEAKIRISKATSAKTTLASTVIPGTMFGFNNALYFESTSNNLWRINFSTLSNESFESKTLKIYPNPASIQLNLSFADNVENSYIKIISILGQTVLEKQNISGNNLSLDVSNLSKGIYVIEVADGNSVFNAKFIKE